MISIVALFFGAILAIFLTRRVVKAAIAGPTDRRSDRGGTCRCGYDLTRLDLPRCPECGLVAHFDATADQMGLTDEEFVRIRDAQRRRQRGELALNPPPMPKRGR